MNTDRFEKLKASVVEAGLIMRGEQRPTRETKLKATQKPKNLQEIWAICLESDDILSLIPRKLYLVKYGDTGLWVRDENGEMTVCDKEAFLPLSFVPEVEQLLAETV